MDVLPHNVHYSKQLIYTILCNYANNLVKVILPFVPIVSEKGYAYSNIRGKKREISRERNSRIQQILPAI